jgi:hypothetical protein
MRLTANACSSKGMPPLCRLSAPSASSVNEVHVGSFLRPVADVVYKESACRNTRRRFRISVPRSRPISRSSHAPHGLPPRQEPQALLLVYRDHRRRSHRSDYFFPSRCLFVIDVAGPGPVFSERGLPRRPCSSAASSSAACRRFRQSAPHHADIRVQPRSRPRPVQPPRAAHPVLTPESGSRHTRDALGTQARSR